MNEQQAARIINLLEHADVMLVVVAVLLGLIYVAVMIRP